MLRQGRAFGWTIWYYNKTRQQHRQIISHPSQGHEGNNLQIKGLSPFVFSLISSPTSKSIFSIVASSIHSGKQPDMLCLAVMLFRSGKVSLSVASSFEILSVSPLGSTSVNKEIRIKVIALSTYSQVPLFQ